MQVEIPQLVEEVPMFAHTAESLVMDCSHAGIARLMIDTDLVKLTTESFHPRLND